MICVGRFNMKEFNWLDFCIPCGSWCCHNENPFASENELLQLHVTKINTKEDGSCVFLNKSGRCEVYANRPLECRIFPFDVQEMNGTLFWVVWDVCPATPQLDYNKMIEFFETDLSKQWTLGYIKDYVAYHRLNQPEKYSKRSFRIIKELNWPTD